MKINPNAIITTCFHLIAAILLLSVGVVLLRNRHYKLQTGGRNLNKDLQNTGLSYSELLQRYRSEYLKRNPPVPKELLHKEPTGIFFGKAGKYVCKASNIDGAVLVVGGAGAGKSSSVIIPTILSCKSAILAIDIKGELSRKGLTAAQRAKTKIFAPADPSSDIGFDPFYLARQTSNPVQSIREIALALIEKPADLKDPYWVNGAQNLFTGALLYGFSKKMNFIEVINWLLCIEPENLLEEIRTAGCQDAMYFVAHYASVKEETLGGIFSELINHLIVFVTDPQISEALQRKNIITPEDLEKGNSIFLEIPEDKLEQWRGLLTVIINLFLKAFERREEGKEPILLILDETPRLGKINLVSALSTLRSRKIHIVCAIQSIAQLDLIYGQDARKVITDNCPYKVVFSAADADTREWLSRLCGTYRQTTISYSRNQQDVDGKAVSISEQEKRVVRPEEFGQLTDIILMNPINGFCRIEKAPYYE